MNASFPVPVSLCRSLRRRVLTLVGACSLGCSAVAAESLVTSFEESEGFRQGNTLAGQEGWTGTETWATKTNLAVTSEEAFEGTQSVLANNAAGAYMFAQAPELGKNDFNSLVFHLKTVGAEFSEADQPLARWEVSFGGADGNSNHRIILQLRYSNAKSFHIHLSSTTGALATAGGNRNILGKSNFRLNEWNEIGIHFDFTEKTAVLTVNGAPVSSGLKLAPENTTPTSRITVFRVATPSVAGSGVSYFDAVKGRKETAAKP